MITTSHSDLKDLDANIVMRLINNNNIWNNEKCMDKGHIFISTYRILKVWAVTSTLKKISCRIYLRVFVLDSCVLYLFVRKFIKIKNAFSSLSIHTF